VPIAAVSGTVVVVHGAGTIPRARRTIRIAPSHPVGMIVIGAVRSPIPSPTAPAPWLVSRDEHANRNSRSESDERRGCDARVGSDVNHGGVVNRNIDYLWISRLDYVDRLTRGLLHFDLKLGITA
jgi:hypothetical protein